MKKTIFVAALAFTVLGGITVVMTLALIAGSAAVMTSVHAQRGVACETGNC
jgi:hypothetical protein